MSVVLNAFLIALIPATIAGLSVFFIGRRWPHLGERRHDKTR
jgi:hypothetical protein